MKNSKLSITCGILQENSENVPIICTKEFNYSNATIQLKRHNKVDNNRQSKVCKPILREIWSWACAVRYVQSEHISVDTFFAMNASIVEQRMNFNNRCKNPEISHLDIMNS